MPTKHLVVTRLPHDGDAEKHRQQQPQKNRAADFGEHGSPELSAHGYATDREEGDGHGGQAKKEQHTRRQTLGGHLVVLLWLVVVHQMSKAVVLREMISGGIWCCCG